MAHSTVQKMYPKRYYSSKCPIRIKIINFDQKH